MLSLSKIHLISRMYSVMLHSLQRISRKLLKTSRKDQSNDYFIETNHSAVCEMRSTDVGDVSWCVPTAQINTACYSIGAGAHSWQWVAQGKSSIAYKGCMLEVMYCLMPQKHCIKILI